MKLYDKFRDWTSDRSHTDLWRAAAGILLVLLLLSVATGCATDKGPQMTFAASYEGDGFIRLTQPVYERDSIECFVEYEHHSEILKETNEDTGDFGILGCTKQFGKWRFLK